MTTNLILNLIYFNRYIGHIFIAVYLILNCGYPVKILNITTIIIIIIIIITNNFE